MAVYVDDHAAPYGRMVMHHMLADTDEELHAMADKIGVARRWHQNGMSGSHYDISKGKRDLAVEFGAIEITVRQAAMMARTRRHTGALGKPDPYYGHEYDPAKPREEPRR